MSREANVTNELPEDSKAVLHVIRSTEDGWKRSVLEHGETTNNVEAVLLDINGDGKIDVATKVHGGMGAETHFEVRQLDSEYPIKAVDDNQWQPAVNHFGFAVASLNDKDANYSKFEHIDEFMANVDGLPKAIEDKYIPAKRDMEAMQRFLDRELEKAGITSDATPSDSEKAAELTENLPKITQGEQQISAAR